MKKSILLISFSCITTALSGCGIGGFWMNGDPSAGRDLKPYIEYWIKKEGTPEQRKLDSSSCNGDIYYDEKKLATYRHPGEKMGDFITRINNDWERCMLKNGYRYTGKCDDSVMKTKPACGAN